jgi:epoxyqueuosine reductase
MRCPIDAINPGEPLDKTSCRQRCLEIAEEYKQIGLSQVCGKCAIGPCSFESAIP